MKRLFTVGLVALALVVGVGFLASGMLGAREGAAQIQEPALDMCTIGIPLQDPALAAGFIDNDGTTVASVKVTTGFVCGLSGSTTVPRADRGYTADLSSGKPLESCDECRAAADATYRRWVEESH